MTKPSINNLTSVPRQYKIKGAPSVGLYMITPAIFNNQFFVKLGRAFRELNNSPYEKNMHILELNMPGKSEKEYAEYAEIFCEVAKKSGLVFIINGKKELAKKINADGVLLTHRKNLNFQNIREKFGEKFIIGIDIGNSIEIAKHYIDNDIIDYVSFDFKNEESLKLIEFWKSHSEKPCLARGYITEKETENLILSGTDFIGCNDFIWDYPDGTEWAIKILLKSIDDTLNNISKQ